MYTIEKLVKLYPLFEVSEILKTARKLQKTPCDWSRLWSYQ
jgi:hypothetical protein